MSHEAILQMPCSRRYRMFQRKYEQLKKSRPAGSS